MSKRLTDTDKWKKPFIRGLDAAYKLLWFYITDDCNHAGVWDVDLEVAEIRLGIKLNKEDALKAYGDKIHVFENGQKWFIKSFIDFQYGELNEANRAHNSVINLLKKHDLYNQIKPLIRGLEGCKDKDKDKDNIIDNNKEDSSNMEKGKKKTFSPPDYQAVLDFFLEKNSTAYLANKFYTHFFYTGFKDVFIIEAVFLLHDVL